MLLSFSYFPMTTCVPSFSDITINRKNFKTILSIETKFGGYRNFYVFSSVKCMYCSIKIVKLHGWPSICVQAEVVYMPSILAFL